MGCCGCKEEAVEEAVEESIVGLPSPDERLAKRAALPEHLRLGVTLAGMRELLERMPSDALEQVNGNIPKDKVTGELKFPENLVFNVATPTSTTSPSGKRGTS